MTRTASETIFIALALLLTPIAFARGQEAPNAERSARDVIPYEEFIIMGHRGMGEEAPEGTIESFRAAWSLGLSPEADIRTTKDGVIVSFHDDNFKRIIPDASAEVQNRGVKDVTYAELSTLDVGAYMGEKFRGQRAVAVAEIVAALKEDSKRLIFCDLKNVDLQQFARETAEVWPQVYLTSSDYNALKEWKRLAPSGKTRLWTPRAWVDKPSEMASGFEKVAAENFAALDVYEIHAKLDAQGKLILPTRETIRAMSERARQSGALFEIMPLTYGDQEFPYLSLLDAGATALSTDYPTAAARALKTYYSEKDQDGATER